jgi:ABC-2 type transport system ATP-binding protein
MAMMANTLIVIGRGQLVEQSSVDDFLAKYADRWIRFASPQMVAVADALAAGGAAVERIDDATIHVRGLTAIDVGEVAARCNATVHELSNHTGSLEDAFLLATAAVQEYQAGVL